MTMLTHSVGPFERTSDFARIRNTVSAGTMAARHAAIRRFCFGAMTVLASFGALTAVIALKAAIYFWRFH